MNVTTDLIVPKEVLQSANISPEELAVEIAVYLYSSERLSFGQARRLSGLDQIAFQNALAERGVYLRIDTSDVLSDLDNLGIKP